MLAGLRILRGDHPRMGGEKKYPFPPRLVG